MLIMKNPQMATTGTLWNFSKFREHRQHTWVILHADAQYQNNPKHHLEDMASDGKTTHTDRYMYTHTHNKF